MKTNDELDEITRHKNIINHIKAQRLSWFGHLHVHRMPEERMVKKKYVSGNGCQYDPKGDQRTDGKMT